MWEETCQVHGVGSDWWEFGGRQYHAAQRAYSIEMQMLAREARRTGKSMSHLKPRPPQYKDLR